MNKSAVLSSKFFGRLERNFVEYADNVAISYNGDERQITYKELNEISARVYGYLKNKGFKPDDFVMIKLPRGAEAGAVAIGVLRAGVAYTLCEEGYPQERIDFIYKDCGCKLCIDSAVYKEILNTEPVYGFEVVDDHMAAIATYTSGTTGNPKGVLLERGRILEAAESISYDGKLISLPGVRGAYLSPLNFIAFFIVTTAAVYNGSNLIIVGYDILRNPVNLYKFFYKARINSTFLTPSLTKLFKEFNPDFKTLILSSEPARNIYYENIDVYNVFAQSETGYLPSVFKIDRPYELTPIGKSNENIKLLDENGREVKPGELGEICIRNEYFRGYINRPEENERAFRGGIYHTGDLGRLLEDDSIVLAGRADDMVKINGNRVEPAEIEEVVKNALGINWAAAKVVDRNGHKSVCAYYIDEPKTNIEEAKKVIAAKLPAYMVPANYMQIVKIPLNANGKFSRRNLPDPQEQADNYKKPQTELEQKLFNLVSENINTVSFGTDTDLVALGLDSIAVMKLCKDITEKLGKEISFADVMKNPTVQAVAEMLEKSRKSGITAYPVQKYYPLTENQRGIYINWELDRETTQYNIPVYYSLRGYDAGKLADAVRIAVDNHCHLKMRLELVNGEPMQKRCDDAKVIIGEYKLDAKPDKNFFQKLVKPFGLLNEPLYRINVYAYGSFVYLFMDFHHIIFDGLSSQVLINDIINAYNNNELVSEKITAYDFALYQKDFEKSEEYKSAEKYFDEILGDAEPARLTIYSKADGKSFSKITKRFSSAGIFDYCKRNGVTASSFMHAAFAETIHRITRENEFLYTTVSNGRSADNALQNCTGMFVQTIPVVANATPFVKGGQGGFGSASLGQQLIANSQKADIKHGDLLVTDYVRSCHSKLQKTFENDCYPYTKFSERHKINAEILFVYQGGILGDSASTDDNSIEASQLDADKPAFSVNILVYPVGDDFELRLEYDGMRYGCRDMQTLAEAVANTAYSMTSAEKVRDISLVSDEQKSEILKLSAGEKLEYDKTQTWVDMFRHQAEEHPDSIAVVDSVSCITYRELDRQSDSVAAYLLNNGVKTNDFVAIKMGRVKEFITAVLGINKAGAAYVPIDPEYPEDRIAYMAEDCGSKLILTESTIADAVAKYTDAEPVNNAKTDNHAYMIYTSGSTGKPKGVVINHRGVTACAAWNIKDFKLDSTKRNLSHPSFSFDASTFDLFYPLAAGASVHILCEEQRKNMDGIADYIKKNHITGMTMSTAIGMALLNQYDLDIEYIMLGGEKFMPVKNTSTKLFNGYGSTEFTVCSSHHVIDQEKDIDIPIGRSVPNSYSIICDSYGNLMPEGIAGELCLAGDQISEGYWNRPELNAEKFAPIAALGSQPVYRTGDRARYNEDGELEYLGRIDFQVKLRGFRIELGEIDNVASQFAGIKQVIAQVKKLGASDSLVLYYSADKQIDKDELKLFMSKSLTDYMVPTVFMQLDEIPMTPNGKIDRKKLPEPAALRTSEYIEPATVLERKLAEGMQKILGLSEKIGINDSFIELGGDSIKAIRLVSILRQNGIAVDVASILKHRTIKAISAFCTEIDKVSHINQEPWTGEIEDSPIIRNFHDWKLPKPEHFNQSNLFKCSERLDTVLLQKAFDALSCQHDLMRAVVKNGHLFVNGTENTIRIEEYDLTGKADAVSEISSICADMKSGIDMAKALMRAAVFKTDDADYFFITAHHLIIDGISWRILDSDLETVYQQLKSGADEVKLPAKTHTYNDYVKAVYEYSRSYRLSREIPYWNSVISGLPEKNIVQRTKSAHITVAMDNISTRTFMTASLARFNAEINDLLLCAVCRSWRNVTGKERLSVQMEGHGREDIGVNLINDRTIGWFTSVYPVVFDGITGDIRKDLINAKETLHRIPNKGVGFNILRYINDSALDSSVTGRVAEIGFNYLGQMDAEENSDAVFRNAGNINTGNDFAPENIFGPDISINSAVGNGCLGISLEYNPDVCSEEQMQKFADGIISEIGIVSEFLNKCDTDTITASDLGETEWTHDEFENVMKDFADRNETVQRIYPLTPMQESMLLKNLQEPDSWAYRLVSIFEIGAVPTEQQLNNVLKRLGRKHEVLRTAIIHDGVQRYRQAIVTRRLGLKMTDLSREQNSEKAVFALREKIMTEDFDLQRKPLFQITCAKISENRSYLIIATHHIIVDGWCIGFYMNDFFAYLAEELYGRSVTDDVSSLDGRYEQSVRELLVRDKVKGLEYWKSLLTDYETCAEIPSYGEIPEEKRDRAGEQIISLDKELTDKLIEIAKSENATVNNVAEMLWGLVLQTYSRSEDVVFAKVVSGRDKYSVDVNSVVGLFINSVPVRIKTDKTTTARELLNALQKQAGETSEWDFCPLSEILSSSGIDSGLLKSVFAFENYNSGNESSNKGSETDSIDVKPVLMREENFDDFNSTSFVDDKGCLCLHISYNSRKYSRSDADTVLRLFRTLANEVCENPDKPLSKLSKVDGEQKEQILKLSAGEKLEYDKTQTWIDLFKRQVVEHPDTVAVVDHISGITYKELDNQSDSVAAYLLNNGVKTNDFVAIKMGRVKEFITAVLGINKAGAAYVPIDPEYPEDRIAYMAEDCGSKVILTENSVAEALAQFADAKFVNNTKPEVHAYMIYTSGSTGKPKGVVINHKSITACAAWYIRDLKLDPSKAQLHHPSFSFDASTMDIIYPLAVGSAVHILSEEQRKDIDFITGYIRDNGVTGMNLSTAMGMAILNNAEVALDFVMMGGEKMLPVRKTDTRIINGYGPTEFTVCSCFHVVNQDSDVDIPIGRPVPNSYSVICDSYGNLMPAGIAGELCLAGDQISEGYWNRPELNAEKFAPIAALGNQPVYRTGDLARYNEDGNLEYLGRIDFQVKLRGFRIELGEIDNVASQFAGMKQVIAQVRKLGTADSLVLYYTADRQIDKDELKSFMAKSLAEYMVPAVFMQLDEMPMTPNCKIDRKKLPELEGVEDIQYIPPSNDIEKTLCRAMADVMGLDYEKTGIKSDFFLSGGTSLIAMKFVARAKLKQLTVMDVYNGRTIEGIAGIMQKKSSNNINTEEMDTREYAARQKSYHLSAQQILMMDSQFYKTKGEMWNMASLLRFNNTIDTDRLCSAVNQAIKNHPSLLSIIYAETNGDMFIKYAPELFKDIGVEYVSENDFESIKNTLIKPYKLIKSLLHRTRVFKTEKYCYLFFDVHHIIADGRSLDILFNDIFRAYKGEKLRTDCYYSHLAWLEAIKNTDEFIRAEKYFIEKYGNTGWTVAPVLDKKTGNEIVDGRFNALLDAKVSDIKAAEKHLKISRNAITISAAMIALADITGEKNIYIEWLYDNRTDLNLGNAFGNLIKSMPVATKFKAEYSLKEILQEVNRQISDGIANSAYDFNMAINSNIKTQALEVNYLQDIGQAVSDNDASLAVTMVPLADSERLAGSRMELYISESDNQIQLSINYLASMYNESTIKKYAELFNKYMNKICNKNCLRKN